jgi:hypothetical protein
MNKKL